MSGLFHLISARGAGDRRNHPPEIGGTTRSPAWRGRVARVLLRGARAAGRDNGLSAQPARMPFLPRVAALPLIALCALALPVWAGENILLRTGFRLPADRHEVDGSVIRIYSASGETEMPLNLVEAVETVDSADPKTVGEAPADVRAATDEMRVLSSPRPVDSSTPGNSQATAAPLDLSPASLASTAARKYSLPDAFVASVMRAESGFDPSAVSPKGAIGLMQLMPATARDLGVDATRPAENADGGARYLRDLLAKYEDLPDQVVLALAAYNAGPGAVDKFHGVPPYRETREYILRVLKNWNPAPPAK